LPIIKIREEAYMKVIIAAAGTGGHINPGIAMANEIKKHYPNAEITFIGTPRGLENDLVPRAGYKLKVIEAYGIKRKISFSNLKNACKTLKSYKIARKIIKEIKPDIVIGTGGYICGPVFSGAFKYGIPTVIHESNAFPGVAVKLLSKKANTVLVGFEDAKKRLPKAKNVIVTGTPTKVKNLNLSDEQKLEIKKQFRINNNLPIVTVFGGSQGAETINKCFIEIINKKMNKEYQIIWAVGSKKYEEVRNNIKETYNASIVPYIYNMEEVLNLADLVVSRSGAMTITEVAKCGKPAIFIPYPYATENHQEYNAKVLANADAARIILDKDLNTSKLNQTINEIILDKVKLKQMGENAKKVSIKNVEEKIFNEIEKLIK
jgi:UDP-N-acetylglucosamine--N-acetylmuramyl-(pentapeptide) pyrophosphoryl-undecaprenol N-acetylglucosamine transferase